MPILREHTADASVDPDYLDSPFNSNATATFTMEQSGAVTVLRNRHAQGYHRYGLLTNRPANREILSAAELEEMDAQLERFADYSAAAIEDYSQYEAAWLATEDGQPLDYELAGIFAPPLSPNSTRAVQEVVNAARNG